ncbi:MAG TPA: hypothetical protein VGN47_12535 [Blastococcus sp.]|nr:hypothetical protein [Blastococcus sp.]
MDDYSEFETTPTAWQEIDEFPIEAPPAPVRRGVDLVALIPGVFFSILAIAVLAGAGLPLRLLGNGGFLWIVLIGLGGLLLVKELRRTRRTR